MAFYRSVGEIPPKRHTQFRQPDGTLYAEELMGEEGFSSDSSLLYHRGIPSAMSGARPWELPDRTTTPNHPLRPLHLRLPELFAGRDAADVDLVTGRRLVLGNADVRICYVVGSKPSPLYRNAIGDECVYIESGRGVVETVFGALPVRRPRLRAAAQGDGASLAARRRRSRRTRSRPTRTSRRRSATCPGSASCWSTAPTANAICTDRRRRCSRRAPTWRCSPCTAGPARAAWPVPSWSATTHPFDVVGWDGCLYPYTFNVDDFEPITGRVHQPPPVHQVFEGNNFVVCNFVPRKVDYHPLSIPVPYYHSNVDSDEVMFYCGGDYEARKGSGIGIGSISVHPGGHSHGPQPGAAEASIGKHYFDELAVMIDTFRPLELGEGGRACDDGVYALSWNRAIRGSG